MVYAFDLKSNGQLPLRVQVPLLVATFGASKQCMADQKAKKEKEGGRPAKQSKKNKEKGKEKEHPHKISYFSWKRLNPIELKCDPSMWPPKGGPKFIFCSPQLSPPCQRRPLLFWQTILSYFSTHLRGINLSNADQRSAKISPKLPEMSAKLPVV